MSWLTIIAVETILASAITAVLFWWDKRIAQSGSDSTDADPHQRPRNSHGQNAHRRIPERTLLLASLLGGWPGGWWAARRFRHKTQKTSFRIQFFVVACIHGLAVLCLLRFG